MERQTIADNLLWPLWRGIDSAYKAKYARNIWAQFEDNIRSAAYTSKVATFYDKLCQRLNIAVKTEDVALVADVLRSGDDKVILNALRNETTYLTLLVRLKNEDRKADYAAAHPAQEELF